MLFFYLFEKFPLYSREEIVQLLGNGSDQLCYIVSPKTKSTSANNIFPRVFSSSINQKYEKFILFNILKLFIIVKLYYAWNRHFSIKIFIITSVSFLPEL